MSEAEHDAVEQEIAAAMGDDETEPETSDDDETEPAAEPELESADDGPGMEANMEEIGKKLDGLQKHVARRMGEILGDDAASFEECEVCSYWNTPGWRYSGPYPPEVETAVRHVMGQAGPDDYKADTYSRSCEACNGLGETVTGSKVRGQETLPCLDCNSRGWIPVGNERRSALAGQMNGMAGSNVADNFVPSFPVVDAGPVSDEIAALKAQGYTVIAPFQPQT